MNNLSRLPRIFIRNWAAVCYSCGWFYPVADSNFGRWIRVLTDSILWLTGVPPARYVLRLSRVLAAGCKLRLSRVPAAASKLRWLEFRRLDASCGWLYPAANSSSGGWIRIAADLYFNTSSKFKDLFCKIQGIIQKKSASGSRTLLFVIFDKKCPFFHKNCYFKIFLSKTMPNVPFFKDFPSCPKNVCILYLLLVKNYLAYI